jgi:4-hydroxy-4-methyl-2-oxoglutarate aldolase
MLLVLFASVPPNPFLLLYENFSPDALSGVMLTGINIPIRIGPATVMPGDIVLGDEEGLLFIPPVAVKDSIAAAENTMARDEWIQSKMDLRKYKSSELYGRPSDPALQKELDEYIKSKQSQQKK